MGTDGILVEDGPAALAVPPFRRFARRAVLPDSGRGQAGETGVW